MAMLKYGSAVIVEPSVDESAWQKNVCCGQKSKCACGGKTCRVKVAKTVIAKYSPEKYLLSHCTIIAAVDTELADSKDPKSDYYIHPAYSSLINNNGDAWSKSLLASCYKTFIGANNYLEHVQIPELKKGKVIDAVLREVPVGKDKKGNELTTYYVDILVATERKHKELVKKIESKQLSTLSMGCKIAYSICSKCGNKAVDDSETCDHIKYEKNNTFYDVYGNQRKVAELCGHYSEPDSVTFIDASWVINPAFTGAVIRNIVDLPDNVNAKIDEANKKEGYLFQDSDFLKAAHEILAQDDTDKEPPPPTEGPKEEDEPAAEPVKDETAPEEEPAADLEAPTGEPEPPLEQNNVQMWKDRIKKKVLQELGDEIADEFDEENGGGGPRELSTLDENLIQPTASIILRQIWKSKKLSNKYLDKIAGKMDKKSRDKLRFGAYMLLTSNDSAVLSNYGYSRRDFLAVMSYIDQFFKNPLPLELKKAVAILESSRGLNLRNAAYALSKLAGRKLALDELKKALMWLRLMDSYT